MFKAENAAGGSVKAGMYSKVQRCVAPVRCLHAFGNSSGYHTTGILRLLLRVVQNYRKADRSHVADELVSGPAGWSTEVDQPRRELETYGSGIEASASSGKQYSSNGLGFNSIQFFVTRDNDPNTASTPASVSRSNRGSFETPPPKHVYTHVG